MQALLPEGWAPPIGYSNGIAVDTGRIIFVAGQVDHPGKIERVFMLIDC